MKTAIVTGLATLSLALPLAGPAFAEGADVERHGRCTSAARWELDIEDEGSNLDVDLEIKTSEADQDWKIVLKRDGAVFFRDVRPTGADGDVEVERLVRDRSGSNRISARGVNLKTDEVCQGSATI